MLSKPELSFQMKLDFINYLCYLIDVELNCPSAWDDDDDKIILAALCELRKKLRLKLANNYRSEYTVRLSACQAIALRLLYASYDLEGNTYFINELRKIADRVHQYYAL